MKFLQDSAIQLLSTVVYQSWLVFFACFIGYAAGTLQIQQIQVPRLVLGGYDAILRCIYKEALPAANVTDSVNPTSSLYSLKWYKGSWEFYRHIPRETPPSKVFLWSDFKIEADDSEPGKVVLRNVTFNAEGSYKCEVSSEGTFHTDIAEANMTVIEIRNETLHLDQEPSNQEALLGDSFSWRCLFGQSRPAAHLSWLVNGEPAERLIELKMENKHEINEDLFQVVESSLEFVLSEEHFINNWLRITCVAQIGTSFAKTKEIHVRRTIGPANHHSPSAVVGARKSEPSTAKITDPTKNGCITMTNGRIAILLQVFFLCLIQLVFNVD